MQSHDLRDEELPLPLDQEAEAHLDTLAIIRHTPPDDGEDAVYLMAQHAERVERVLADSERMMIGIGRSILRDSRRIQALARQRETLNREIDLAQEPMRRRIAEGEAILRQLALLNREAGHGNELIVPGFGRVATKRSPANFKIEDPDALIADLLEHEAADLYAPLGEPVEPTRKVNTRAVKQLLAIEADRAFAERYTVETLRGLSDDAKERLRDEVRAEVARKYAGITLEPTTIGATFEVTA